MIGIIITGHGHYASGILSSVELILGKQENLITIDFPEGDTKTELENNLANALKTFETMDDVVIFTDLKSGSPFNVCIMEAMKNQHLHVFYGTNLAMLIENIMKRNLGSPIDDILENAVACGQEQIGLFELPQDEDEDDDFDD